MSDQFEKSPMALAAEVMALANPPKPPNVESATELTTFEAITPVASVVSAKH